MLDCRVCFDRWPGDEGGWRKREDSINVARGEGCERWEGDGQARMRAFATLALNLSSNISPFLPSKNRELIFRNSSFRYSYDRTN